jgi:DegV family protein with EDD domain
VTVHIISDSSCNVPDSYQRSLGIIQVPAWVNFADGTSLRNGVDISDVEFYRRLQSEKHLPTTSQPTPQDFIDIIHTFGPGDEVILACVSSKMSGTYNSAVQARDALPAAAIFLYDTLSVSMGGAWQIIAGAEMARQGADAKTILQAMESSRPRIQICFTIDTLKYLAASGRAPTLQAMLGNLLDSKPMMRVQDGVLALAGKVRGRKRSKRELLELVAAEVGDKPVRLAVVNANIPDEAAEMAETAKELLNVQELLIVELGAVLGALTGPGTLALSAFVQE